MKNKRLEKALHKLEVAANEVFEEHRQTLRDFGKLVEEIAKSGNFAKFVVLVSAVKAVMEAALDQAMKCANGRPTGH